MADKAGKKGGTKPDLASLLGLVVGIGGILGGMLLEKGELRHLYQVSAAIIVLGGTFGAVMVTTPMNVASPLFKLMLNKSVLLALTPASVS